MRVVFVVFVDMRLSYALLLFDVCHASCHHAVDAADDAVEPLDLFTHVLSKATIGTET